MSAPELTKEEAEEAIRNAARYERFDISPEDYNTLLTLARAGAAVMFPGEEDVERVARAMTPLLCGSQEGEMGEPLPDKQWDAAPPDWQDLFKRYARAAIAAMKP